MDTTTILELVGPQSRQAQVRRLEEERGGTLSELLTKVIARIPEEGHGFGNWDSRFRLEVNATGEQNLTEWIIREGYKTNGYFNPLFRALLADSYWLGFDLGGNILFCERAEPSRVMIASKDDFHTDLQCAADGLESFLIGHSLTEAFEKEGPTKPNLMTLRHVAPHISPQEYDLGEICDEHEISYEEPDFDQMLDRMNLSAWVHLLLDTNEETFDEDYALEMYQELEDEFDDLFEYFYRRANPELFHIQYALWHGYLAGNEKAFEWALRQKHEGRILKDTVALIERAQNGEPGEIEDLLRMRRAWLVSEVCE